MGKYRKERNENIPCNNKNCHYHDESCEGHCDAAINEEPAINECPDYSPQNIIKPTFGQAITFH